MRADEFVMPTDGDGLVKVRAKRLFIVDVEVLRDGAMLGHDLSARRERLQLLDSCVRISIPGLIGSSIHLTRGSAMATTTFRSRELASYLEKTSLRTSTSNFSASMK